MSGDSNHTAAKATPPPGGAWRCLLRQWRNAVFFWGRDDKTSAHPRDRFPYLLKLAKHQAWKSYGVVALVVLLVAIGVGLPIWFFFKLALTLIEEGAELSWETTVPSSAVAIALIGFVWHGVRALWKLELAWGMRAGQLEDLGLAIELAAFVDPRISIEDAARLIMSLRRDQVADKYKIDATSVLGEEVLKEAIALVKAKAPREVMS